MAARTRADDRDSATEFERFLPAGVIPPDETGRLERLRGGLFNHGGEPTK